MAIADVAEYAHLSDADLEALGCELEAIRRDIEDSRGEKDRAYIQRAIAFQRCLDVAARLVIAGSRSKARLGARNHRARRGQEHREHGTRP
jgi:NADPH-dependent stearoyl-CoA 9-desaturase